RRTSESTQGRPGDSSGASLLFVLGPGGRPRGGDGLAHGGGHGGIEGGGDDVLDVEVLLSDLRDGAGRGDLHGGGDLRGTGGEGAVEDAGEGEDVVDLVRQIGTARRDDAAVAVGEVRVDLRVRVGQGEEDGTLRHDLQSLLGDGAGGQADEGVGA